MSRLPFRGWILAGAMLMSAGCSGGETRMTKIQSKAVVTEGGPSAGKYYALRLAPGADLRVELQAYAKAHGIHAGGVVTAVGSLSHTVLRLADQKETRSLDGKREIVSLVGTVGTSGCHLHLSVSDSQGVTLGGHLSDGCIVYTTAEIVLADMTDLKFERAADSRTGFRELIIQPRTPSDAQ